MRHSDRRHHRLLGQQRQRAKRPTRRHLPNPHRGLQPQCAIATDDTIACWGYNDSGQSDPPAGTYQTLTAGAEHTCAIATDDTIACWGQNGNRQIDPPAGTYQALALGEYRTCAIKSDNTIVCWPQLPDGVRWAG